MPADRSSPVADVREHARVLLQHAVSPVVLTGAGMSAASGVPTFRGAGGLWRDHRPEALATPEAFARDPRLVWEWYGWRRDLVAACAPNAGHRALAHYLARTPGATLVTQNVDGLHTLAAAAAGDGAPRLHELHGTLFRVRCTRCDHRAEHRGAIDAARVDTLPRCGCGALLRPDVVWFGEALPQDALGAAVEAAAGADVCLVVGTSGVVYPAAAVAEVAARAGAALVLVNPDPTPLDALAAVRLAGDAAELLPPLLDAAPPDAAPRPGA